MLNSYIFNEINREIGQNQQLFYPEFNSVTACEITNAIDQSMKEINQRYDFKGSKSRITLDEKANSITVISDDEFKIEAAGFNPGR